MKIIRSYLFAAFPIVLLLSHSPAQSMQWIKSMWAKMPSSVQLTHAVDTARHAAVTHPAVVAAVAIPVVANAAYAYANSGVKAKGAVENIRVMDLDIVENVEQVANDHVQRVLDYSKLRRANGWNKTPGALSFIETLVPLMDRVPMAMPELCKAWNNFVVVAHAYDRSADELGFQHVTDAFIALEKELEIIKTLAPQVTEPVLPVQKSAPVNYADVISNNVYDASVNAYALNNVVVQETLPNAEVAPIAIKAVEPVVLEKAKPVSSKLSAYLPSTKTVAITAAGLSVPVVAVKTGLVNKTAVAGLANKAVALYNGIDIKPLTKKVVDTFWAYKPAVTNALNAGLTIAQNNKGAIAAGAAVVGGIYGGIKLGRALAQISPSISEESTNEVTNSNI